MKPIVIIYWVVVGIPLSWGLYKSIERSIPLFKAAPPAAAAPAKPAEPAPAATPAPK